jgi:hypothetical protein
MGVDAIDQTIYPSFDGVILGQTYIGERNKTLVLIILYSYLMGVDAIDQTICPEVLGMTKCSIA